LLLDLRLVPFELLLDLLDLRLEGLHRLHRLDLLDAEREQHDPEDDREQDDRDAEVPGEVVEAGQQPPDRVEKRLERTDLSQHRIHLWPAQWLVWQRHTEEGMRASPRELSERDRAHLVRMGCTAGHA